MPGDVNATKQAAPRHFVEVQPFMYEYLHPVGEGYE